MKQAFHIEFLQVGGAELVKKKGAIVFWREFWAIRANHSTVFAFANVLIWKSYKRPHLFITRVPPPLVLNRSPVASQCSPTLLYLLTRDVSSHTISQSPY